jgi:hypothetical protein
MTTPLHAIDPLWTMWAHLPQDTDWSSESYRLLMDITYVEELIELSHTLPDALLTSCMLFFMVQGVKPVWEDPKNRAGGCFSYKVSNKQVPDTWRNVVYSLAGGCSSPDAGFRRALTGCSLSPKKGFCIINLWMSSTVYQSPSKVQIPGLKPDGCLFKRHGDA